MSYLYRILFGAFLERLSVCQEHACGRRQFHFLHEQRGVSGQLEFHVGSTHKAEVVFASHELNFHAHLVQHVTCLKEYVAMNATDHAEFATLRDESAEFSWLPSTASTIVVFILPASSLYKIPTSATISFNSLHLPHRAELSSVSII